MKRTLLAALALASIIVSCQQAPVEYVHRVDTLYIRDTVHAPNNERKGILHGKSGLYDYTTGLVVNTSGIKVTMEGTAYSAITDSAGNWSMHDLPTGSYNIIFEKDGYQPYRRFSFYFVAGADSYLGYCALLVKSLTPVTVSEVGVKKSTGFPNRWYFSGQISPVLPNLSILLFFGRDSTVSLDSATHVMSAVITRADGRWEFKSEDLMTNGFQRGDNIFMVSYPGYKNFPPYSAPISYWNPISEKQVTPDFTGKIRSNVVSFTLP
jgi:hypothetical protein